MSINNDQPMGFLTPPPTWRNRRPAAATPRSEMRPKTMPPQSRGDAFHVIHKIPSGDSPYVRAKHVQLVEKDPSRAISLFWAAINAGDRVDSALKDMALVMKQLNRSDEAIEAIKSFRHLSPPESQESIDNILVELFKQSGRRDEEIALLQHKLKQVEEGMAFSGRKTKLARSQGKKIQITVQKEYSRLLGNLAWAYMQNSDFKSAEEHYRKALSFEADKNKQCNLAVCLMHMNKLSEAKFLLETIPSANGVVDESYAKSYERASEILAEFESQNSLRPKKHEFVDEHQSSKPKSFGSQWGNATKRADFDWRKSSYEPNREAPKAPSTQPRRCMSSEDQRKVDSAENAQASSYRNLCFGSSISSYTAPDEMPNIFPHFLEKSKKKSPSTFSEQHKKSWADMVEEEEYYYNDKSSFCGAENEMNQECFNDENVDSNIVPETPKMHDLVEELSEEMGSMDIGGGYLTQPDKTALSKPLRRSLCFDEIDVSTLQKLGCSSPLKVKGLDFEGGGDVLSCGGSKNRRRLQVFQDITCLHGSPRP